MATRVEIVGHCGRYEPRFKPPRERLISGEPLIQNHLSLGGYDTLEDAKIVRQIAAFYYGKAEPHLDLGDNRRFAIDSSWNEQLDFRRGKEKAKWVASKAKAVFQDFKKAKATSGLLNAANNHTNVIPSGDQLANARDWSHSRFSSPAIYKSPENLASSSRATLPVASNSVEDWFVEAFGDAGDGAVNKELSGDVEYLPVSSPLPVTLDSAEPTSSSFGLPENIELSLLDSVFIANGHPQCSAVNATANELRASLFEPDGPCSPLVEITTLKENEGSYVEAATPAKMSLDITVVPVEVALPTSQGLQSVQDRMDVGAPPSDPSFSSDLSKEDYLFKLLNFYRQENSELRREVKRLKGESLMSFDA